MNFEAVHKETVMLNPQEDMAERRIPCEIRTDPLTGRTARICHFREELKWDVPDLEALVAGSDAWCPFCPDKVLEGDALLPPRPHSRRPASSRGTWSSSPTWRPMTASRPWPPSGPATTFPCWTSRRSSCPLRSVSPWRSSSGSSARDTPSPCTTSSTGTTCPRRAAPWSTPHLQVFATSSAPNLMRMELEASRAYMDRSGKNYWEELTAVEMASGERYLGTIGRTHWMTSYAPMGRGRRRAGRGGRRPMHPGPRPAGLQGHRVRPGPNHGRVPQDGDLQLQRELLYRGPGRRSRPPASPLFTAHLLQPQAGGPRTWAPSGTSTTRPSAWPFPRRLPNA